ncbi:MAG: hypothetical protein RLZZ04_4774 [Cyanobacteriota bacterium]|jgi:chromosome segregation ATPase
MTNPVIQTDIADILNEIKLDQRKLLEEVNTIKLSQSEIKGDIKALDNKLTGEIKALDTKVDQLDKRISNSEFTNRGIFVGIVVIIFGSVAKYFGLIPNY